ncbi:hypothetical protein OX459_04795 [Janthinobacterium sp. SUN026]|uniref:hypothetical protein n=1 Tax=Janthinobacterium sp. SUN026 TaxID=3002438 RepID=UPI0025B09E33|nr:hypothetical protein [Janthinobacterium sp. SUN026]MDN2670711.1 hypothetical protein [Janthinobacterium sp. SUN026]
MRPSSIRNWVCRRWRCAPSAVASCRARARAVDHFQQFGKAQDHQRHRVVAVQVRVQDQVRLVAHAREQCAPGHEGGRGRDAVVRRGGNAAGLAQQGGKLRIQFGAAHAGAEAAFGLLHGCCLRARLRRAARQGQQRIADRGNVVIARHLLAREVDGDVFFVDEDAGNEDHGGQVEQIDQRQFAPHRQFPDHARDSAHHACPTFSSAHLCFLISNFHA